GLDVLGSSRGQQFGVINGRSTTQVTFRYEIAGTRPGRYVLGPIRVAVGNQLLRAEEVTLVVAAPAPANADLPRPAPVGGPAKGRAGRGSDVASLVLSLEPPAPVVGQACRLRVQLVQRVEMSEDSDYDPPGTPGYWSESWSDLSRYRAREGRRIVIVTESALRLYPLAP